MANRFTNKHFGDQEGLRLSNGATDVLIFILARSASDLSQTLWQKQWAIWISEQDQSLYGSGCIGFDISEIPFDKTRFADQKEFVLSVINNAIEKQYWLEFEFADATKMLSSFQKLISDFKSSGIEAGPFPETDEFATSFKKCEKHKICLHTEGCCFCNAYP